MRSLTFAGMEAHIDIVTWQWSQQAVGWQSDTCALCLRVASSIWHVDRKAKLALRCVRLKPKESIKRVLERPHGSGAVSQIQLQYL